MTWLGMMPWEFWAMTPAEFMIAVDGFQERWNRAREVDAWMLQYQVAVHMTKDQHKVAPSSTLRSAPGYDHARAIQKRVDRAAPKAATTFTPPPAPRKDRARRTNVTAAPPRPADSIRRGRGGSRRCR